MLEHPAPDQSGDGRQQREPELVAEARHAVAGLLVVPGMDVTFSTRAGMRRLPAVRLMILMMMLVLRHGSAFLDALMHRAPAGRSTSVLLQLSRSGDGHHQPQRQQSRHSDIHTTQELHVKTKL